MDTHSLWVYLHILLFVYWLGADLGLYLVMAFVKNPALSFETRVTLIRLAFYVDLFPRITFALILPVGMHLVLNLGLYLVSDEILVIAWIIGILWSGVHLGIVRYKGTARAELLSRINRIYEAAGGLFFVTLAAISLASGAPVEARWLAWKLLLFGLIFWVILGFDTLFRPFTTILRMGPEGSSPAMEATVTRVTNRTMLWSLLLYVLIAAVAFLGTVKPGW